MNYHTNEYSLLKAGIDSGLSVHQILVAAERLVYEEEARKEIAQEIASVQTVAVNEQPVIESNEKRYSVSGPHGASEHYSIYDNQDKKVIKSYIASLSLAQTEVKDLNGELRGEVYT